jgi:hypothetical protein
MRRLSFVLSILATAILQLWAAAEPAAPPALDVAARIQPVPRQSVVEHQEWFTWGASVLKGDDGRYHMVYCRWPKKYPFGDGWLIDAELCYATADQPGGPFKYIRTILQGRKAEGKPTAWDGASIYNPHLKRFNGKIYLYYAASCDPRATGLSTDRKTLVTHQCIGVVEADSLQALGEGKFTRRDEPLFKPVSRLGFSLPPAEEFGDRDHITPANVVVVNPSVVQGPDGRFFLVFKGWQNKKSFAPVHGIAISDSPTGPFTVQPKPIFTNADGSIGMAEDPFAWYDSQRKSFFAIVKDFKGQITQAGPSLALFESPDGLAWKPAEHVLASKLAIHWADGVVQKVYHLERPQLLFDDQGNPIMLYCACMPTAKQDHAFNVHIPLMPPK